MADKTTEKDDIDEVVVGSSVGSQKKSDSSNETIDSEQSELVSDIHEQNSVLEPAFRGNFQHSVDDKGRVSFPSEFRKVLSEINQKSIVLTNHISDGAKCLDGFSVGAWAEFEMKLRTKSRFNPKVQKLENFYLSRATRCSLDSSGRILIPTHLRVWAEVEKDVTFTSSINGFRIWNRTVWDSVFGKTVEELLADPGLFDGVDLLE